MDQPADQTKEIPGQTPMRLSFKGRTLLAAPAGISTCSSYPCRDSHHVGPWPRSLETLSSPCSLDWLCFFIFFIGVAKELFPGQLTQSFGGAVPDRRGTAVEAGSAPVPSSGNGTEPTSDFTPLYTIYTCHVQSKNGDNLGYQLIIQRHSTTSFFSSAIDKCLDKLAR